MEKACFAFVFKPVTLAFDVDDGGAMQKTVEGGACHDGVTGSFGKGLIGGDDSGRVFLVTVEDDLEEHGGASLIETEITDFVDEKEPWPSKGFHGVWQPVLFEGGTETTGHFHGGEEEETVSESGGHLIDLCVLTDTLVIDGDGIYDPRQLNDRLLLGLKGTMSEFELGLLRQWAQEALRQKISRGEVLTEVPIGYVRTETNGIEKTPDRQVQEAIAEVFLQFRRLGSVRQVLLWYRQEKVPLCIYRCDARGQQQVLWDLPGYNRILAILKNPVYAGAFAYGRTSTTCSVRSWPSA